MDKKAVFGACMDLLGKRITELQASLESLKSDLETAGKSSAGDKHETARAMMQLEEDKICGQLKDAIDQKTVLEKLPFEGLTDKVRQGHLVGTDKGYFYLGISLGKVLKQDTFFYAISADTPMGQMLLNRSVGEVISMRGTSYRITCIS